MLNEKILDVVRYTKNFDILYIEDNIEVQDQTYKMLKSFFNDITTVNNGKEAIELFINNEFHLIITDLVMPQIDGISFIEFVRKSNKKIPILVVSAHDDKDFFLKTINSGIDGYLLKPYNLEQITSMLINIVEKYNTLNESSFIYLENDLIWDKQNNRLLKNNEPVKLTKNETKLFQLFINTNSETKTYEEIEDFIFDNCDENTKKIRNLLSRLKSKLGHELFETLYSYGYCIKYKKD
ncbi:DNA-binding response regulator [Malaciobacter pacificus]|uniref:Two-component system response regulator n=1 Tax=Malaciobacter pacificus TaxID=1080223 RepID=A0A5C2HE82_9BACT|nr:response regulator transcription factor [Malaciobacter pacificus]QEP34672.1 two-component system response regulator [Malaciobacter pacificus]GGD36931.1 DNA-binding response regulator [Malaciobacter pacificus]